MTEPLACRESLIHENCEVIGFSYLISKLGKVRFVIVKKIKKYKYVFGDSLIITFHTTTFDTASCNMAPIRVGIIGLSAKASTSWASRAHLPYLVASNGKYEIKALCNSSVDAARAAVNAYKLPSSTKAYGDPQALANDPDVRFSSSL